MIHYTCLAISFLIFLKDKFVILHAGICFLFMIIFKEYIKSMCIISHEPYQNINEFCFNGVKMKTNSDISEGTVVYSA